MVNRGFRTADLDGASQRDARSADQLFRRFLPGSLRSANRLSGNLIRQRGCRRDHRVEHRRCLPLEKLRKLGDELEPVQGCDEGRIPRPQPRQGDGGDGGSGHPQIDPGAVDQAGGVVVPAHHPLRHRHPRAQLRRHRLDGLDQKADPHGHLHFVHAQRRPPDIRPSLQRNATTATTAQNATAVMCASPSGRDLRQPDHTPSARKR